jgi:DNA-binding NtrC family response regulator
VKDAVLVVKDSVLIVEDDAVARDLLAEVLRREGHAVTAVASAEEALTAAEGKPPRVLVTDLRLDGMSGIELMGALRERDPSVQAIVVTAFGSLETAVEAIHAGAFDYMSKPFRMEEVCRMVQRALQAQKAAEEVSIERGENRRTMIGRSDAMTRVYKAIARVAPLTTSVLIQGETGTGKELVARAIHDAGPRAVGPYVAVNCPSLPEGLLESELFGHVRGAFTGATTDRPGLFEAAGGGTILLDEIGDMPLPVQAKLLRVLETGHVRRVGSSSETSVDVRVVAATNRDLERCARKGEFREDLLYRLNAVTIRVPALRERSEDIPLLVDHFLQLFAGAAERGVPAMGASALEALFTYPWPGNVRELAHVIERAIALSRGTRIEEDDLPSVIRFGVDRRSDAAPASLQTLEDVERAHILSVLKSVGGVRRRAAAILGIDRKTLYRKLLRFGLAEGDPEEP